MNSTIEKTATVALVGNPNCGKTTIFNLLTGLNQKTGNFPGVTVDKKTGTVVLPNKSIDLIDLPGTYSLYPNSKDERIAVTTLSNPKDNSYPDLLVYVADITSLERHLLLLTQIIDLQLPVVLLLNMTDIAEKEGLTMDIAKLSQLLQIPVINTSGRTGLNMDLLKETIEVELGKKTTRPSFYKPTESEKKIIQLIRQDENLSELSSAKYSDYHLLLLAHHQEWLPSLSENQREQLSAINQSLKFERLRAQINETMQRFNTFTPFIQKTETRPKNAEASWSDQIDNVITHRFFGPLIFFALMLFVFQAIYSWSGVPMDMIEGFFGYLSEQSRAILPEGWISDLVADGILAGLGGVLVFIPQIAILFFLISLLEEVGYMARAVFMFDGLMQRFGLNGRSIVALISGGACAIPAIMSTRTISNAKERLITILVTPWISCSARIPVYTILIGFVVPANSSFMGLNAQGLAFMGLYLLGIVATLLAALVFKYILKSDEQSYLMIELPVYQKPMARNVLLNVYEKVKTFTLEAGKVILIVSIVLWFLANYSMPGHMQQAEAAATAQATTQQLNETATADLIASKKLEASFAGKFGKAIEPAIKPLGFDWKIGIALLTSFAAREVFVGTMASIYSIGSTDDELTIRQRMAQEINPHTNQPVFTMATSLSLLIFYVFAMQCMGTLAVVYRETKSWKWPIVQFVYMTLVAYFGSLLVYQIWA